jgi:hypothetical protein
MGSEAETRVIYLDLMKKCLTNWIYGTEERVKIPPRGLLKRMLVQLIESRGLEVVTPKPMDPVLRAIGRDHERGYGFPQAHTMIGLKRLDNIQFCAEDILSKNIPGDFIECGVWRGGAAIFMRAILNAYHVSDRTVWVADSFEGCPQPDAKKYPHDMGVDFYLNKDIAVPLEWVKSNFERYGLLDNQVMFLKGWFKDTLPQAPIQRLSLLRIDGDLYESTMDALVNLYGKLSLGGYVVIDDFWEVAACRKAVLDYRKSSGIEEKIIDIDRDGVYWQRSR